MYKPTKLVVLMKKIILSLLLLSSFLGYSQTLQRGKGQPQKKADTTKFTKHLREIAASYDQSRLNQLYSDAVAREKIEKKNALDYATKNNIPVFKYNEDGSFDELMKISPDGTPIYYTLHNVNAAISTRANHLNSGGNLGLNVNGDGMTAHVWDGGPTRPTHEQFDGTGGINRVSINDGVTGLNGNSFHAQHVTGTIIASGQIAGQTSAKGMAWQADALTHDWNNDYSEATTQATAGMLLSNHSYGYNASAISDAWFGQYGSDAREWDQLMYASPYYLMVNSAGNDGADNTSNGIPLNGQSAYDKLNGTATAKNNFVIGNAQDASIDVNGNLISVVRNSGSSEGPTDDYRIKPDIMGNGTQLYSTYDASDSDYASISGTSMSAPNVTGTLLLLQEHYFKTHGVFMKAATLKGLALHTADDTDAVGPDANTGWGLLNAKAAAEAITAAPTGSVISELTLSQGQTYQVTIQADGINPLLASISWTDPAGTINNGTNSNTPALINDLDIRLSNGSTYTPWKLTGVTTNATGDNIVDPYERIDINGASGQYTLTITHKGSLSSGSQDFSLIVTGGIIAATTPEISFGTITTTTSEATDCNYTDVTIPVNIAMAPSQDADVNFTVSGGTASNVSDFTLETTSVTFLQGETTPKSMTVRIYHDGFIESTETIIVDFSVSANGGDATANPLANSLTISINDDDVTPPSNQDITVFSEDFEDTTGWTNLDRDGDTYAWILLSFTSGGFTGFSGQFAASETNMDLVSGGGTGTANADNYYISPAITIPASTTNTAFNFAIGGFNSTEHYRVQWTTDISNYTTIDDGIILEEANTIVGDGEIRTVNNTTLQGQTGYFVIRHYNSNANDGILLFDALEIITTIESPVQTTVNNGTTNDLVDLHGLGTLYATDSASGDIMLSPTNNDNYDYNCVDFSVSRAGTGAQAYNGSTGANLVLDKTFNISPTNTTTSGDTSITFYFTEEEISGWETAVGGTVGVTRNTLVAARGDATNFIETSALNIGSFGSNVTLTGDFTGLDGTYYFGPIGAFVSCSGVTKTWNGFTWIPVGIPDSSNPVIIDGIYNTFVNGNLNVCTLTVNTGATLTIDANSYAKINEDITVNGTLIVEHQGSVVQENANALVTNNGTINVNVTTPTLKPRDFMMMGSPMTLEQRTGVFANAYTFRNHVTSNFIPHPQVAIDFPGAENFVDDNFNDFLVYTGTINPGEGYLVRPQPNQNAGNTTYDLTYTLGTLNNGNVTYNVGYNTPGPTAADNKNASPNMLANPYASAISANDFINANAMVDELYFWEHVLPPSSSFPGGNTANFSMEDISMYNLTGGTAATNNPGSIPNEFIATGQGFAIKANAAGTATFSNTMRRTDNNNTLRNPLNTDRLWLKVRNEQYELDNTTLIGFNEQASAGLDPGYDSRRLATIVSLYSHLEDGSQELGIQSREAFDDAIKIPMGFSTLVEETVEYTISITNLEGVFLNSTTVYLVDNLENITTNLNTEDYVFSAGKGTYDARFTLMFQEEIVLSTQDVNLDAITLYPNPTKGIVNINSPNTNIISVEIYDITGRKIKEVSFNNNTYQIDINPLQSSQYFVNIKTENGSVTKRIIKK